MKKTFYFIRHGQTDLNLKGIVQGRGVDSPLNDNGFKQAQAFYDAYKDIPFDKITEDPPDGFPIPKRWSSNGTIDGLG